jgi:hypothetical protein
MFLDDVAAMGQETKENFAALRSEVDQLKKVVGAANRPQLAALT